MQNLAPKAEASSSGGFLNSYQKRTAFLGTSWATISAQNLTSQDNLALSGTRSVIDSNEFAVNATPANPTSLSDLLELQLCADTPSLPVDETDENNNCSGVEADAILRAKIVERPDLVVSEGPTPVQSGELIQGEVYTFTGNIQNTGNDNIPNSPSFASRFQIGSDVLPNAPSISGLDVGEEKPVFSGNWIAVAGEHTLKLCADEPGDDIVELSEANNCAESTILVAATRPIVNAVELTLPSQCEKIALTYSGGTGADYFELYHKQDSDTLPYVFLERKSRLSDLREYDPGLEGGSTYFYMIKAFSQGGIVTESVRPKSALANSCPLASKPDLIATRVVVNGELTEDTPLTFTGTVTNSGDTDVPTGTNFANTFTILKKSPTLFQDVLQNGLAKDTSAALTTGESWVAEVGTYTIKFCTNTDSAVDEVANDIFNCTNSEFTVTGGATPEDLLVTLFADKSGTVAPLENVSLTANVEGSATGGVTYEFDYTSDGEIDVTKSLPEPAVGNTSYSTVGSERYDYTNAGKYVARVDVSRGGETAFAVAAVNARPKLTLVTGPACKSITASWGAVNAVTSYILYRSATGLVGSYAPIATLGVGETSYPDTDPLLSAESTYYYQLRAILTDASSLYSDAQSQTTAVECPQSNTLTVVVNGSGVVKTPALEINCGNGATSCGPISYPQGTDVMLTEEVPAGVTFSGWSDACSGAQTTCSLTLNSDLQAVATFTGTPSGPPGPIQGEAPTVTCSASSLADQDPGIGVTVEIGDTVVWTADPSGGNAPPYTFEWTADDSLAGETGQSFQLSYDVPGQKNGTVIASDVDNLSSLPTPCSNFVEVKVPEVCTPGVPNFGLFSMLQDGSPGNTMYMDSEVSDTSSVVVVGVIAPACFTSPVTFQDPTTDKYNKKYGNVQTEYNSSHDVLQAVQYDTGSDMSITLKNSKKYVPDGDYDIRVYGSDGTFTQYVDLILRVQAGSSGPGGSGPTGTPKPTFEEF